ncbi:GNAT family N-acetyltransferase [Quadrisphaera sp. KR29]|uniref:GNAT family N-acetyltransferase n=1 Tax=Quadrisphaera sp. KR29 TaxID=3461391 RepID=UPI00404451AC
MRERLRAATWSAADTAHLMNIREMTPADLPRTAFWHRKALPQAFFTRLGPRFLRRWQHTYLDSPHAIALMAERTDVLPPQPVAFLLAATDAQAHQAHVLRHHRLPLTALGLGALLVRPAVLVRFLRTRAGRYIQRMTHLPTTGGLARQASPMAADAARGCPTPSSTSSTSSASSTDPAQAHRARVAVVVALVVDVKVRRSGVGRALLDAFTTRAAQAGADRAELVTAWASDAEVFYDECGWSRSTMRPNRDGSFVTPFHLALGAEVPPAECARHAAGPVATSSD